MQRYCTGGGYFYGDLWCWLFDFQVLAAGVLAVAGALAAIWYLRRRMQQAARIEAARARREEERSLAASEALRQALVAEVDAAVREMADKAERLTRGRAFDPAQAELGPQQLYAVLAARLAEIDAAVAVPLARFHAQLRRLSALAAEARQARLATAAAARIGYLRVLSRESWAFALRDAAEVIEANARLEGPAAAPSGQARADAIRRLAAQVGTPGD